MFNKKRVFFMSNENSNNDVDVLVEGRKTAKVRLLIIFTVITLTMIGLGIRIFYITLIKGDDLRDQAFKQWFQIVNEYYIRGNIYDRKGNKLIANNTKTMIKVSDKNNIDDKGIALIAKLADQDVDKVESALDKDGNVSYEVKSSEEKDIISLLRYKGVSTIKEVERYNDANVASHLIGYISESEGKGLSGIEKYYDKYLGKDSFKQVGAIMDAQKRILPGYGYVSLHKGVPDDVYLTIDEEIQIIAENALDRYKYKGSVVVLDNKTGNVMAMVSRPNFSQNNVAKHIDSTKRELINKSIQMTYPPGSIFKIVVAAGLIEDGHLDFDDTLICDGSVTINNTTIKCSAYESGGHGSINFYDAFSKSCNSFFIQGAQALGGDRLLELSKEFGLGIPTGVGLGENSGSLPTSDYVKGAGIGNVAIGQGTLEVTPLQVARMTSIISNNGIDVGVHIIDKIESRDGIEVENDTLDQIHNRVVKRTTANMVSQMMKNTIEEGTGKRALIEGVDVYGKTGSAQAGVNGEKLFAWFSGFFLGEESEYVITVVIEDENQGGGTIAAPVFSHIANDMISFGM